MTVQVTIQTGARLHFGLLAHRPQTGRHFGGAGLMIDSPGVELNATVAERDQILHPCSRPACGKRSRRLSQPCKAPINNRLPAGWKFTGRFLRIRDWVRERSWRLAVGKALAVCAGEPNLPLLELAQRVGRGARSALGIHGFQQGGFLIDGGKRHLEDIGTLVSRTLFPSDWRVVLVTPPLGEGLSGTDEQTAFHRLAGMSEAVTNRLCRLLLMEILPAILEGDFRDVSEGVYEYGQQVGAYFEPVQGGRLASLKMAELAGVLRNRGIMGVGQSSWGPTLFVLQENQHAAEELLRDFQSQPQWAECEFHIAAPKNEGTKWWSHFSHG